MDSSLEIVKKKIYYACKTGMSVTLCNYLRGLGTKECHEVLHAYNDDNGQHCTPLLIAARNGHDSIMRILLKYSPNLNIVGNVKIGSSLVHDVSPLFCAAGSGNITVVKLLVQAGANVNQQTESKSTPLIAACFVGRLDIVKFLLNHHASVHICNIKNCTCLMQSASKGHIGILRLLIERGADVNVKSKSGATALHLAAENGHLRAVEELLNAGAKIFNSQYNMSPLMVAAGKCKVHIVEFFLSMPEISKQDKIDAYELLGASLSTNTNDDDYVTNSLLAFQYLTEAMIERYSDPHIIIHKPETPMIAAYGKRPESRTLKDLSAIQYDPFAMHMEGLMIRQRILGDNNPEVFAAVYCGGAYFADRQEFSRCLTLWKYALYLTLKNNKRVTQPVLRFVQIFAQMLYIGVEVNFEIIFEIFDVIVEELKFCKEHANNRDHNPLVIKEAQEDVDFYLVTALYLIMITSWKLKNDSKHLTSLSLSTHYCDDNTNYEHLAELSEKSSQVEIRFRKIVYCLIHIGARDKNGCTLLHLAVSPYTPVDDHYIDDICKFPCAYTTKLLIACGADVNARDLNRNTPLHLIVPYEKVISDFFTLHNIIMALIDAGAHIDIVNDLGETPLETAVSGVAEILIRSKDKPSLQCLAARIVIRSALKYKGLVPFSLESFIEMHGPCRTDQLIPTKRML